MRNLAVFFMICNYWSLVCAENYAVIIGGSGEDFKTENFFLHDFDRFNRSLRERGFKITNIFDREKTANKFQAKSATNKNISDSIEEVTKRAKKGDQILIMFHTHGVAKAFFNEIGHSVSTESGESHLSKLLPNLQRTKAKILLVDLSCYSGNTQQLISDDGQENTELQYDDDGNGVGRIKSPPMKVKLAQKKPNFQRKSFFYKLD